MLKASRPALVEPYTKFDARVRTPATLDRETSAPCPCAAKLIGDGQARAHRACEVDVDQLGGGNGVVSSIGAQLTKGLNHDVEVAVISRDRGDPVGVPDVIGRVEVACGYRCAAQLSFEASGICRVNVATTEHNGAQR